jgi:4-diphosphocytidyl-2-C-methyl-D-erythritol kinase
MTTEVFAPAKVNLSLHVTGQRSDGYHLLDSLVVFADVGDRLWLTPAPQMKITISGPFAPGVPVDDRNLVWRAAQLAGWCGHIMLEKNLPHGAGIGGGSADAAAVLRSLGGGCQAASLGADVPVCLSSAPQRMSGTGEILATVTGIPALEIVLVNPGVSVPTAPVFAALQSKTNAPMTADLPRWADAQEFCKWLSFQRNDLEPPARTIAPGITEVLQALDGALLARMSGSGATCFGLYAQGASAQAARIAAVHPDWWVVSGRVISSDG